MNLWFSSLGAAFLVSLLSFVGVLFLAFQKEILEKIIFFLVSFAAGVLLGDVFLHLLPEAVAESGFSLTISLAVLSGILIFFILEKFIYWHHCHLSPAEKHPHSFALMNLFGDGLHNFIDGLVIAGSFSNSFSLGAATTMAVIFHEIPQEIGDFGVLIHGGFSRGKALLLNFVSALMALLGVVVGLFLASKTIAFSQLILPLTAGGFLYIAGTDLIPELHKETNFKKSLGQILGLILGIVVMLILAS